MMTFGVAIVVDCFHVLWGFFDVNIDVLGVEHVACVVVVLLVDDVEDDAFVFMLFVKLLVRLL